MFCMIIYFMSLHRVIANRPRESYLSEVQKLRNQEHNMAVDRKQILIKLGATTLAEALLELAVHYNAADELVRRLTASADENIIRFKQKLSNLTQSDDFVDWRESSRFASELEMLLQDLDAGVTDPLTGLELVASFYEADEDILNNCDDSDGDIDYVFQHSAKELFVKYGKQCSDKEKIADIILKLNRKNPFGVRDTVIDCAFEYLSETTIRDMVSILQEQAEDEPDQYDKRRYLVLIESLARQIKDARLYEKTCKAFSEKLSTSSIADIARVYLESGDADTAYSWVQKIPKDEISRSYERDQLLHDIYIKQGDTSRLADMLHQQFRAYHTADNLLELLEVIGEDKRDAVISEEVILIMENSKLQMSDAQFLISINRIDKAEEYLLKRCNLLNDGFYSELISVADAMESEKRVLVASLIYRSLLLSILERGYSKAYHHGVKYLNKLDELESSILDWYNNALAVSSIIDSLLI